MVEQRLRVGDRVRIKDRVSTTYDEYEYQGQWVEVLEVESAHYAGDLTYLVRAADGNEWWPYDAHLDLANATSAVILTLEKAVQVREALEAIGWNRDDLGPLAQVEKPQRVIGATITLPDDDQLRYARADITTAVEGWNGTITFDSDN